MEILQGVLDEALQSIVTKAGATLDEGKLTEIIEKTIERSIPKITDTILNALRASAPEILKEQRRFASEFAERNYRKWSKGFDSLEALLTLCMEAGANFNKSYRPKAVSKNDIVFDTIVRLHARACQIAGEILCLLKNGYADGAHARWRTLHEVAVTAFFIAKHGQKAAERYYNHEFVESYKGMLQYQKWVSCLNEKPFENDEIEQCKKQYETLLKRYGKNYENRYGWAVPFLNNQNPNFSDIERDVDLGHMRPYYQWASQNIHATVKGIRNRLGLAEAREEILLAGHSDGGMTDPAHSTAISLSQATTVLLNIEPNLDRIVTIRIILIFVDEVGKAFLESDKTNNL